jgi:hypothetical protein
VTATEALANRPEAFIDHRFGDKARAPLEPKVQPTSWAADRRSCAGRHMLQSV